MGASYTSAQARAAKNYLAKFDDIRIRVPSGKKEEYKRKAAAVGKSLNRYIVDLLDSQQ